MDLIVEPEDGVKPILAAIRKAKKSLEIAIFRFDRADIEAALKEAADRGVRVNALIAHVNRGGEEHLRRLEMRFLDTGISVARTADDLRRYHDKILIVDRRILYLFSFNFTHLDIGHSRGFGIVTRNAGIVREAARLFEADSRRTRFTSRMDDFVVSPGNSRAVLGKFLARARKELLVYDPKIADREMIRILEGRAKAGVDVRIIGSVNERSRLRCRGQHRIRLHTRTIIRDRRAAFVGSQSLRRPELDSRREAGIIVREGKVVKRLHEIFEAEWVSMDPGQTEASAEVTQAAATRDAPVEVSGRELKPLGVTVKDAVEKAVADAGGEALREALSDRQMKDAVQQVEKAVTAAVEDVVHEVLEDAKKT